MHPEAQVAIRPVDSLVSAGGIGIPTVGDTYMMDINLGFGVAPEVPADDLGVPLASIDCAVAVDIDLGLPPDMSITPERVHISAPPTAQETLSDRAVGVSYVDLMATTVPIWDRESSSASPNPTLHQIDTGLDVFAENERRGVEALTKMMTDKAGVFMSALVGAMEAHMAACNGSDGHVFNRQTTSGESWIKAYDGTQSAIQQAIESDPDLKTAADQGTLSVEQEAKLQKLALKVYGKALNTDTSKLQAMTSELYRFADPTQALQMMQNALSHEGCACHPTQLAAASPSLFGGALGVSQESKCDKHQQILCTSCGWTGVQCESEPCPKCRAKERWIIGEKAIKKFLAKAKHN